MYWPPARAARLAEWLGLDGRRVEQMPLSFYRERPFYLMRNDALDRFGTRVEHRFARDQVRALMEGAGLRDVEIADGPPYWCALGRRYSSEAP